MIQTCLANQIGKTVEVYVDDVVIKTKHVESLVDDLRLTFNNLRTYDIKLNPENAFSAYQPESSWASLYSVEELKQIQPRSELCHNWTSQRTSKKIQKLTGCVAALSCFISLLGEKGITPLSPPPAHRTLRVDGCRHGRIGRNKSPLGQQPNLGRAKYRRTNAVIYSGNTPGCKRSAHRRTRNGRT